MPTVAHVGDKILGLESSCDETAIALFDHESGLGGEWIYSQIRLHEAYGGVVPDLATREHLRTVAPLLQRVQSAVGFAGIESVAVTHGPGLAACLAIGVAAAKALALALRVPVVGVNHLRAHVWSVFLPRHAAAPGAFAEGWDDVTPHLGLLVSGGNTLLATLERDGRMRVLSTTRDDAAGEALDKGAKLLGLGYPGGPLIEERAVEGRMDAYDFPRGIGRRNELDFSFSGLKTSLRYQLEKMTTAEVMAQRPHLCASYQQAVIDALVRKTRAALDRGAPGQGGGGRFRSLGLSGGVANNRRLRAALEEEAKRFAIPFLAAEPRHTGDNAAMIAFAAWADRTGTDTRSGMGLRIEPGVGLVPHS